MGKKAGHHRDRGERARKTMSKGDRQSRGDRIGPQLTITAGLPSRS